MKKILFIAACFAFVSSGAQTADEIIQGFTTKIGGLENFNKVKTARITANFNTQGLDLPMTIQIINNRASRTDLDADGKTVTWVYKDGKAWTVNPFAGINSPKELTGQEFSDFKAQSTLASALIDHKARGHQVELQGQEVVEGIKTWKIKFTNKEDGKIIYCFINTTDSLLIKTVADREMQGQTVSTEVWYSDLKEFGGLKFFMTKTSKIDGEIFQTTTFSNVELNVPLDEKIFEMPK